MCDKTTEPRRVHLLRYREWTITGRCEQIVGIFADKTAGHQEAERICSSHATKTAFWNTFPALRPDSIRLDNFTVETFSVQGALPTLDDWKDGHCDAWDYEAVLRANEVAAEWCDTSNFKRTLG